MAARSKARKRALDILFASELRSDNPIEALATTVADGEGPVNVYTTELVEGVHENRDRIDEVLREYAQGWTLERMPAVDRNVLRIGVFEILFNADVPDAVAMSESLALVRELSTDDSPAFVNGVLGAIARDKSSLV
ncbi:transcription antitermination factor NusB [Nocardioides yefusunii]|uniref:Transcription antitermination protein NusB n=1 Tax=Nocardioides yefusunii TaxID=2500546 RepID=A0ABW1R0I2_9ACTN|nr:transcription antitermination factor NusB [Nocardioides yefusunii]